LREEVGELASAYLRMTARGRAKGATLGEIRKEFEDELADCLAQIVLIAERFDVDLDEAVNRKWFQHLEAARAET
ncbi:MAG: MazG nucleotide pyrophosphohydrolase domain-containing protein, partial [Pseudomonadota bacterium]